MGEVFREECIGGPAGIVLGTARAVKAIEKPKSQDSRKLNYSRELRAIAQFSQPEVTCHCLMAVLPMLIWLLQYERWFVKAFGWFENTDSVFIAMEFFQHGDLYKCMGGSLLPEIETQTIISQILTGLSYMHTLGYAHRDLKPQVSKQLQLTSWVLTAL
jgi:serine/threonine protein kinase